MIPIALVADNRLASEGLASLLRPHPDIRVVATVDSTAARQLREANPKVVLVDCDQGNPDELPAVVESVVAALPDARVIVIDVVPDQENIPDIIQAGVSGLTLQDVRLESLVNAIRSVARGGHVWPPRLTGALFSQIREGTAPERGPRSVDGGCLTPRQLQVVELLAQGLSNKRIAVELRISVHTVKSHVRAIMKRLGLNTRLKVAAWAHREGTE
jgi:DNA-binding NarL/FixJ family response regulator